MVLSLSPGLGPEGLHSPGGYPHRGAIASNGTGSCAGSPPPYPGSASISYQQQRHQRERGASGIHSGISTTTSERTRPNSGGPSRNSPFNTELLAAAMRSNTEIPNISATLLSPRIRASINDEPDIKRELDSPTPKRPRISVSSQELLDQLSVVHEGARRFVTNTGNLASLEHPSTVSQRSTVPHPPPTRSPLTRRGPLRTVILNSQGTTSRWIPGVGGNERTNAGHNEPGSFGGYQSNSNSERGIQRTVHTRRSPNHHPHHHNHREYHHNVRRSPNHYHHNYHNQHHTLNRRNTRQRERERERNRAAAIAAARAVAANLQDSFNDIVGEEVCITEFWHSFILNDSFEFCIFIIYKHY